MAKKWSEIRRKHSPEVEERIRQSVKDAAGVMALHQLQEQKYPTALDAQQRKMIEDEPS